MESSCTSASPVEEDIKVKLGSVSVKCERNEDIPVESPNNSDVRSVIESQVKVYVFFIHLTELDAISPNHYIKISQIKEEPIIKNESEISEKVNGEDGVASIYNHFSSGNETEQKVKQEADGSGASSLEQIKESEKMVSSTAAVNYLLT